MLLATVHVAFVSTCFGQTTDRPRRKVKVAVCQFLVLPGALERNLAKMEELIARAAAKGAEICAFCELPDLGFEERVTKGKLGAGKPQPIPGPTTDRLGAAARKHGIWIVTALAEKVPGGGFDTNVFINPRGRVVLRQRKLGVYPQYAGAPCYFGNYHDSHTVPSPWGPMGVLNCVDAHSVVKRATFLDKTPALMFITYASPGKGAGKWDGKRVRAPMCREFKCPIVAVNLIKERTSRGGRGTDKGGGSWVAAGGFLLWKADRSELVKVFELDLPDRGDVPPEVFVGSSLAVAGTGTPVTLDAHVVDDATLGEPLKLLWTAASGQATFADPKQASTTVKFEEPGTHTLTLTARDGVWTTARSLSVTVLPTKATVSPAARWPFSSDLKDATGTGHDAVAAGAVTYAKDVPPGSEHKTSLVCNGATVLTVPHHDRIGVSPRGTTVTFWVKNHVRLGFYPDSNIHAPIVVKGSAYSIKYHPYAAVVATGHGLLGVAMNHRKVREVGTWHHVAAVADPVAGESALYVDGVLESTVRTNRARNPQVLDDRDLQIGKNFKGLLADVRIYHRALASWEVAALVPGARPNAPPVLSAGPDLTCTAGVEVPLKGTFADDRANISHAICTWTRWRVIHGPANVDIVNRYIPATTATFDKPGTYLLELSASDGGHLVFDTLKVTVR